MFLLRLIKWLLSLFFPSPCRKKQAELRHRCVCLPDECTIRRLFPGLKIRKQGGNKWVVSTPDSLIPYLFFCAIVPAGKASTKYTTTHAVTSVPAGGRGCSLKLIEYLDPQRVKMRPGGEDELRSARICSVVAEQEFCLVDFYKPKA